MLRGRIEVVEVSLVSAPLQCTTVVVRFLDGFDINALEGILWGVLCVTAEVR